MSDTKKPGNVKPAAAGGDANNCKYSKCRDSVMKYGFCASHFDQFKFGLLTKHGAHVPDFDKKIDHFMKQKGKTAKSA